MLDPEELFSSLFNFLLAVRMAAMRSSFSHVTEETENLPFVFNLLGLCATIYSLGARSLHIIHTTGLMSVASHNAHQLEWYQRSVGSTTTDTKDPTLSVSEGSQGN